MNIQLSSSLSIPVSEYAIQGNAVLGIRDSGKSYTATFMAERLLDAQIPFIAFDPIGVWKGLKYGKGGHSGYPVVVAGGMDPDINLDPEQTEQIVRAAMKENVPLVLDLYSVDISKAEMKRIVLAAINVLLYENGAYGLRHVFIEEAAEFVPQAIRRGGEAIYSAFDKLGRMGGNVGLGYTLINQRAADVNKSILELTNTLFLHKQTGSNSIQALQKWLKVAGSIDPDEIASNLATLEAGECYIWLPGFTTPEKVRIPEKNTIHPDRRKPQALKKEIPASVKSFIQRMSQSMMASATQPKPNPETKSAEPENGQKAIALQLQSHIDALKEELKKERSLRQQAEQKLSRVRSHLEPQFSALRSLFEDLSIEPSTNGTGDNHVPDEWTIWLNKFENKPKLLLETLILHKRLDRARWCKLTGVVYSSSKFDKAIREFKRLKLVRKEGNEFVLEEI